MDNKLRAIRFETPDYIPMHFGRVDCAMERVLPAGFAGKELGLSVLHGDKSKVSFKMEGRQIIIEMPKHTVVRIQRKK